MSCPAEWTPMSNFRQSIAPPYGCILIFKRTNQIRASSIYHHSGGVSRPRLGALSTDALFAAVTNSRIAFKKKSTTSRTPGSIFSGAQKISRRRVRPGIFLRGFHGSQKQARTSWIFFNSEGREFPPPRSDSGGSRRESGRRTRYGFGLKGGGNHSRITRDKGISPP